MSQQHPRLSREKRTVKAMVHIACRGQHDTREGLCEECEELVDYALDRLDRCPFGASKPTCADCPIHCYRANMRESIRSVMRYAGPRMLFRHPLLALGHVVDGLRQQSAQAAAKERGTRNALGETLHRKD